MSDTDVQEKYRYNALRLYKLAEAHSADERANETPYDIFRRAHRHDDDIVGLYLWIGNISAHHVGQIECDGLKFAGALAPKYSYVVRIQFRINAACDCQSLASEQSKLSLIIVIRDRRNCPRGRDFYSPCHRGFCGSIERDHKISDRGA